LRRTSLASLLVLLVPASLFAAQVVDLAGADVDLSIEVVESNAGRTVIEYTLGSFTRGSVEIDGEVYDTIGLGDESRMTVRGLPELPNVARSIIIPDDAEIALRVVSSHAVELEGFRVAPSKGTILRNVDPRTVEYTFDSFYESDDWYPADTAYGRDPYIMRDHRGMVVVVNPFQYNHATGTLRVYDHIVVAAEPVGPGRKNVLTHRPNERVNTEFRKIYRRHFLNYDGEALARYASVGEIGNMLVIAYDDFMTAMEPLVEWKNQMGVPCEMVAVSVAGPSSGAIESYIQTCYDTNGLAYVLLVGDGAQVPTPYASGGESDPTYSLTAGSDSYPDLFVGRFSAESVSQVETQVLRTIEYEKFPQPAGAWYHKGTGIASNQGPGDDGEYDDEHVDAIRNDLLAFTYTEVDRIYDPSASSSMVANALNNGRSVINYTGHGSSMGWVSSGFSNTHVNALSNDDMLPFIVSVACVNGNFDGLTCFAEAWLRATNGGEPTGAIATYMSSINQSWNPPMAAQDETVDLLVEEEKRTFGGLCYNGSALMMDQYGWDGEDMFLTWHIFGDPSVRVRTGTPGVLTVVHDAGIDSETAQFDVTVEGVEGALCALYLNGVLYGSALSDPTGLATIDILETPPTGEDLTVTVTAFNAMPHFGTVLVGQTYHPAIAVDPEFIDVVMEPGLVYNDVLSISNSGEPLSVLSYNIEVVDAGTTREIEGSTMTAVPTTFAPGTLSDFIFSVTNESTDEQWINGIGLDFPEGLVVSTCTDFTVGARSLAWDSSSGDGAYVRWSGSWENVIYPGETAEATITVFVVPGTFGNVELIYALDGDSWGAPPSTAGGTIVLEGPEGPSVTLLSPNGGEMWGIGELNDITWSSVGEQFDEVGISYSSDGGLTWFDVVALTADDGIHPWLVDGPESSEYLMRVTAAGMPEVDDTSDGTFVVYQPVAWLTVYPASGDVPAGETLEVELTFDSSGLPQGDYFADILIDSNGGNRVTVPVALHVSGTGVDGPLPTVVALYGNFPNPFNPSTRISFALPEPSTVKLTIYDVRGRVVRRLSNEHFEAGRHEVPWDGKNDAGDDVSSGIYFYEFEGGGEKHGSKMVLTK